MSLSNSLQTVTLAIGAIGQFVKANWLVLLIAAVVFGMAGTWFGGKLSERRSKQADAKVAQKQAEIDALQAERDQWAVERVRLLAQADRTHAEAEIDDATAAATKALIDKQGTVVRDAELKKIEAINEELKRDAELTSVDIPDAVRRERVCAKLRAANIPCGK